MKIVKYDKLKAGQVKADQVLSGGGGGGSTTTIEGGGSVSLDRVIWGKQDTGDDIDGHMTVNGDVHIKAIDYQWDDDDDDEGTGDVVVYDEGGGNLNVELKTTTKDLEATNDAYVHKHLYINYSHDTHDTNKKCVAELIKVNEDNIKTNSENIQKNADEISSLKDRMSSAETAIDSLDTNMQIAEQSIRNNAEEIAKLKQKGESTDTDISGLEERISNNETNISNNANNIANNTTEIENIKNQMADGSAIDTLTKLVKYGDYSNPVVLYCGVLKKLSTTDLYTNTGCYKDCFIFTIKTIEDGVMTIELTKPTYATEDLYIYVRSVNATQEMSDDTSGRENYYKGRSNGAHWFESWFEVEKNKTTIYLREFHQGNGDNDTWYSSSWFENGGPRAVNLTINGYVTFMS